MAGYNAAWSRPIADTISRFKYCPARAMKI